jgi:NitT/TauT family transport system ATP-binding protein
MTGRPGRVRHVQEIGIPRPRGTEVTRDPGFHAIVDELTALLDDPEVAA